MKEEWIKNSKISKLKKKKKLFKEKLIFIEIGKNRTLGTRILQRECQ